MFDLSLSKLLILAVLALVVFGPGELPKMAAKAGRALRELRQIAEGAKADLREGLGPEFSDFDFDDLSPRRFVQKHLLSEPDGSRLDGRQADEAEAGGTNDAVTVRAGGEPARDTGAVFDTEAT